MDEMLECWEEFMPGPPKRDEAWIRVSLTRKRELRMNARAVEALGSPPAVVLLYDRMNARIGIRASEAEAVNAFPLRLTGATPRMRTTRIYAAPFCKFHGIRNNGTLFFADPKTDEGGIMVLDLRQTYEREKRTASTSGVNVGSEASETGEEYSNGLGE